MKPILMLALSPYEWQVYLLRDVVTPLQIGWKILE